MKPADLKSGEGVIFEERELTDEEKLALFVANFWLCVGGYILNRFRVNSRDNFLSRRSSDFVFFVNLGVWSFLITFFSIIFVTFAVVLVLS